MRTSQARIMRARLLTFQFAVGKGSGRFVSPAFGAARDRFDPLRNVQACQEQEACHVAVGLRRDAIGRVDRVQELGEFFHKRTLRAM